METRYPPDDAREWLNRARSSLRHARARTDGVYLDDLCFDAQQAAEKAIKAVLITLRVRFPYVHDLAELLRVIERAGTVIPDEVRAAAEFTPYALELRYPNREIVDDSMYTRAVEVAHDVVSWAAGEVERAGTGTREIRELPQPTYVPVPPDRTGRAPDPALIDEIVTRIGAAAEPDRIILFGSAARASMGPHSDLDVLVVKSEPYDHARLGLTIREALRSIGIAVDVVLATPADLERYGHSWALVYRPALEEGRVIYEAAKHRVER